MKKNILVIDDSALMRRVISDIINSDKDFQVKDFASNGLEALDLIIKSPAAYDAAILDINMPKMNGLEFLEQLNKRKIRLSVIVVSTVAKEGAKETIRALELGAFDFVTKPDSFVEAKGNVFRNKILDALQEIYQADKTNFTARQSAEPPRFSREWQTQEREKASEEKPEVRTRTKISNTVFARNFSPQDQTFQAQSMPGKSVQKTPQLRQKNGVTKGSKLIALACSTGGPKALQSVVPFLPAEIDAPMLIVQHMPEGFTKSLAVRLDEMSKVRVKEAEHDEILEKGVVYIAKGGSQMRVLKAGGKYKLSVTVEPARNGLKPCADIMYESLVGSDFDEITCVVLTGMGGDGTLGIKQLKEKNQIYCIAQDAETSIVYGMPKVVYEAGLVDEVHPLTKIPDAITRNVGVQ